MKKEYSYLIHKDSKSKYKGGFIDQNGRKNNSKEYNHDYYIKNKWRWNTDDWFKGLEDILDSGKKFLDDFLKKFDKTPTIKKKVNIKTHSFTDGFYDYLLKDVPIERIDLYQTFQKKHKYLYKIKKPNGGYRYFYTEKEYSQYMSKIGRLDKQETIGKACKEINKLYNSHKPEYTRNCPYATLAYELRRRGYDVEALPSDTGLTASSSRSFYKNAKAVKGNSLEELFSKMKEEPDGARGSFSVAWRINPDAEDSRYNIAGGHIMAWEKINGTVYIVDAQTNTIHSTDDWSRYNGDYVSTFYNENASKKMDKRPSRRLLRDAKLKQTRDEFKDTPVDSGDTIADSRPTYFRTDNLELSKYVVNNFVAKTSYATDRNELNLQPGEEVETTIMNEKTIEEYRKRGLGR